MNRPESVRTAPVPLEALISLKGRRALVTGAAAGIGEAIAYRLAEAGADLVLADRDAEGLAAAAERLEPLGRRVDTREIELGRKEAIDALWEDLAEAPPDILVNNAGIFPSRPFEQLDEAFYERVLGVNLEAVVWMCRGLVEKRGRRGGVIVNIGSIEAVLPFKDDLALYSVSKAGVIALTRALAREHARHGFRANVVLPGGILTPGTKGVAREAMRGRLGLIKVGYDFRQRLPAGRMGRPDDIARVVLFLASDLASYMHGAVVAVDGGFLSA